MITHTNIIQQGPSREYNRCSGRQEIIHISFLARKNGQVFQKSVYKQPLKLRYRRRCKTNTTQYTAFPLTIPWNFFKNKKQLLLTHTHTKNPIYSTWQEYDNDQQRRSLCVWCLTSGITMTASFTIETLNIRLTWQPLNGLSNAILIEISVSCQSHHTFNSGTKRLIWSINSESTHRHRYPVSVWPFPNKLNVNLFH